MDYYFQSVGKTGVAHQEEIMKKLSKLNLIEFINRVKEGLLLKHILQIIKTDKINFAHKYIRPTNIKNVRLPRPVEP
jgi:hypothetical protein